MARLPAHMVQSRNGSVRGVRRGWHPARSMVLGWIFFPGAMRLIWGVGGTPSMLWNWVLSGHAKKRCQLRGISREVIDLIVTCGSVIGHGGARKHFMNRKTRARAMRDLGPARYRRYADRLDIYVVAGDSTIVTVAKPDSRIRASKPHKPFKPRCGRGRRRF